MDAYTSFFDNIFSYPLREQLLLECPALTLLCYRHLCSKLITGCCVKDPLSHTDALSSWLAASTVGELCDHVLVHTSLQNNAHEKQSQMQKFRANSSYLQELHTINKQTLNETLRMALRAASLPQSQLVTLRPTATATITSTALTDQQNTNLLYYLYTINGVEHFVYSSHGKVNNAIGSNYNNHINNKISRNNNDTDDKLKHLSTTEVNRISNSNTFTVASHVSLNVTTLHNTLAMSTQYLRKVTSCALSGSLQALAERRHAALRAILLFARLVPLTAANTAITTTTTAISSSIVEQQQQQQSITSAAMHSPLRNSTIDELDVQFDDAHTTVTSEGLNFCMLPLHQQWWVLLNGAIDRVLALLQQLQLQQQQREREREANGSHVAKAEQTTNHVISTNITTNTTMNTSESREKKSKKQASMLQRVTKPLLWQMLAILALLDTTRNMYAFPSKEQDLLAHHLLARLAEIGLVYPVKHNELKCFALSPHFYHALQWQASAPLCHTAMVQYDRTERQMNNTATTANNKDKKNLSGVISAQLRREDIDTIITQTNFRLYAYTRNQDLLRILDQFAVRQQQIENVLVCYRVTRNSFASALRKGITAAQVLKFLSLRAHPSMLRQYGHACESTISSESTSANTSSHNVDMHDHDKYSNTLLRHGTNNLTDTNVKNQRISGDDGFAIPRSFCDQLLMWEVQCNRVTFTRNLVLLRNVSPQQQTLLRKFFSDRGEVDAIFYSQPGYLVIKEEVYDRLLASLMSQRNNNNNQQVNRYSNNDNISDNKDNIIVNSNVDSVEDSSRAQVGSKQEGNEQAFNTKVTTTSILTVAHGNV